ncbi:MAG TPA: guanylate kinase [Clostridiales bacterium]|nr:guanylate kinase [Clostridiales bacterium]
MDRDIKQKEGLLIVISGPSGAGKGTVCRSYLKRNPDTILSVSVTTRQPRRGEKEGVNYFFRDKSTFESMIENDEFLEYAMVYDNYYGTPKEYVFKHLNRGKDVILEIDIQGALQVKKNFEKGVFIFIMPPSMKELKRRIVSRGTETPEVIMKRFKSAYDEINFIDQYNYIVVNDRVDKAVKKIEAIVMAEKCKVDRNRDFYINIREGGCLNDRSTTK